MHLARKFIDAEALSLNYRYLKNLCQKAHVLAVIKSEAYGHGLLKVARALCKAPAADGFAVAIIEEAAALREAGITQEILILQGVSNREELRAAVTYRAALVAHSFEQLELLERYGVEGLSLWLKFDTGMNRLGFSPDKADTVLERVSRLQGMLRPPVLMSHFAYANEPKMQVEDEKQWLIFEKLCAGRGYLSSIANSAGVLCRPKSHQDWARVGISLYGVLPEKAADEHRHQLKPVMKITAPLISIRRCKAGDQVGYEGAYTCRRDMKIGIVGIGYGEGYPRSAPNGTPVWLGGKYRKLAGHVSMGMLAVELDEDESVAVGDFAELWGPNLAVSEVARHCRMSSYELLCSAQKINEA